MAGRPLAGLAKPVHSADAPKHTGHHIAEPHRISATGLCLSVQRLCRTDRSRLRTKLRPNIRDASSTLRVQHKPNGLAQPSFAAGRQFLSSTDHGHVRQSDARRHIIPDADDNGRHRTEQEQFVGKRHAWIPAGEQRTAALTQL